MDKVVCYGFSKPTDGDYIFYLGGESTQTKPSTYEGNTVGVGSLFVELDTNCSSDRGAGCLQHRRWHDIYRWLPLQINN